MKLVYTCTNIARALGVSYGTATGWVRNGKLTPDYYYVRSDGMQVSIFLPETYDKIIKTATEGKP